MLTTSFNNETEFNKWVEERVTPFPIVIEGGGEMDSPDMYPCIMVYDWIEHPYCKCDGEEESFNELEEDGYYSDEIEMLKYHYVYRTKRL